MNDHTISLVRESFDLIEPIAPQAGALFYAKLFEADPSLRRLFPAEIEPQSRKLMQMLTLAVAKLNEPAVLLPTLRALGSRHAGYGVREADYDTVGAALLATLREGSGVAWTAEVEAAWIEVYGTVAATMKDAATAPVSVY